MGANSSTLTGKEITSGRNKKVLHLAAKAGDAQLMEQLLQPLVSAVTAEMAIASLYPGAAAAVLSKAVGRKDRHGRTAFLEACLAGSWECADLLLEAGCNILAADADGNGCLHLASINGHGHVVEQLLAKAETQGIAGRLVNTANATGAGPLHYAAWSGHAHIVRQLLVATSVSDRLLLQGTTDTYDRWLLAPLGATVLHVAAQQHRASVVLVIMQHYALLLRDWVPLGNSSRRPVDPRTWTDAQGATPLHVALWKGLDPSSQLATLLHPRTDAATLFSLQQLEELRKRGPPTLQVIAIAALRAELLRQLREQQQLLTEQQQLLALQAAAQEQQRQQELQERRRRRQQESKQRQERIWQRWWGRDGADTAAAAASPYAAGSADIAAVGATAGVPQQAALATDRQQLALLDSLNSKAERNLHSKAGSSCGTPGHSDSKDDSPWRELRRTPSITLGAVQQYSSLQQQHQHQQHQRQLQSASSITLGCLDRLWLAASADEQQRDHKAGGLLSHGSAAAPISATAAAAAAAAPISATAAAAAAAVCAHTQGKECLHADAAQHKVLSARLCVSAPVTPEPGADGSTAARHPAVASTSSSVGDTGSTNASNDAIAIPRCSAQMHTQQQERHSFTGAAAAKPASPEGHSTHIYKGVGAFGSFQLQALPLQADTTAPSDTQQAATPSTSAALPGMQPAAATADPDTVSSKTLNAAFDGQGAGVAAHGAAVAVHGSSSARAAVQAREMGTEGRTEDPTAGASTSSPSRPQCPPSSPNLAATSITLAQLAQWQQQDQTQGQETGQGSVLGLGQEQHGRIQQQQQHQHVGSGAGDRPRGPAPSQPASKLPRMFSRGRPPLREASRGGMHPVLATAGIKTGDMGQFLTPLAWKLLQQQHQDQHSRKQQAAQPRQPQAVSSRSSSRPFSNSTGPSGPTPPQQDWQSRRQLAHSGTHRRSFEMPGSTAEVFGARRQHVARMLSQAQAHGLSRHSLLGAAAAGHAGQGSKASAAGASGSRRGSLDRAGLSLDVATSLAGALPGCVSEKLSRYLQVYGAGGGGAPGGDTGSFAAAGGSGSWVEGTAGPSGGCASLSTAGAAPTVPTSSGPSSPGRAAASMGRSSFLRFKSVGGSSSSRSAAGPASGPGAETCAVCMDQACAVTMVGCGHSLCFACAGCIVGQGLGVRPPLCPFCRKPITELQASGLHGGAV